MNTGAQATGKVHQAKRWTLWAGRILTALPILMMSFSATMKFIRPPQMLEQFVRTFGYPESTLLAIGVVEISCVLLYAIPRTAILGAVLITGYLGGAVATHVRIADPSFVMPFMLGVLAWAGVYLRDERLRALMPLRRT